VNYQVITASVPLSEMFGLRHDAAVAHAGPGQLHRWQFERYDEVPKAIAEGVIAKVSV